MTGGAREPTSSGRGRYCGESEFGQDVADEGHSFGDGSAVDRGRRCVDGHEFGHDVGAGDLILNNKGRRRTQGLGKAGTPNLNAGVAVGQVDSENHMRQLVFRLRRGDQAVGDEVTPETAVDRHGLIGQKKHLIAVVDGQRIGGLRGRGRKERRRRGDEKRNATEAQAPKQTKSFCNHRLGPFSIDGIMSSPDSWI